MTSNLWDKFHRTDLVLPALGTTLAYLVTQYHGTWPKIDRAVDARHFKSIDISNFKPCANSTSIGCRPYEANHHQPNRMPSIFESTNTCRTLEIERFCYCRIWKWTVQIVHDHGPSKTIQSCRKTPKVQ